MKTRLLHCLLILMVIALKARAADVSWEYNPYAFQYDMTVYIGLSSINEESVTDVANYQIAAFCLGECRGIAEHKTSEGHNYIYLRVRSNTATGETISFMVKNLADGRVGRAIQTLEFGSEQTKGYPSNPFLIDVRMIDERATTVELNTAGYATYSCFEDMVITTEGVQAYKAAVDGNDIVLTELDGYIPAGTGVLLYSQIANQTVNLKVADAGYPADVTGNELKATTLADGTLAELEVDSWALGISNAFLHYTSNAYVHHRAYLVHTFQTDARAMNIIFTEDTSSLDHVVTSQTLTPNGKYMQHGKVFIRSFGHEYNAYGQVIK